jgi:hypothetical protein
MPSPPPTVKLKRLKFDCAEADAMSPQKTSNKSIRFFNLDLLFRRTNSHAGKRHNSSTTAVFHFDARSEKGSQPFSPTRRIGIARDYSIMSPAANA